MRQSGPLSAQIPILRNLAAQLVALKGRTRKQPDVPVGRHAYIIRGRLSGRRWCLDCPLYAPVGRRDSGIRTVEQDRTRDDWGVGRPSDEGHER
jgi:hypothetical protein